MSTANGPGTPGPDPDARGTMGRAWERAVRIGLPALIFTEHFDFDDRWLADRQDFPASDHRFINSAGYLHAPPLDVAATSMRSIGAATGFPSWPS